MGKKNPQSNINLLSWVNWGLFVITETSRSVHGLRPRVYHMVQHGPLLPFISLIEPREEGVCLQWEDNFSTTCSTALASCSQSFQHMSFLAELFCFSSAGWCKKFLIGTKLAFVYNARKGNPHAEWQQILTLRYQTHAMCRRLFKKCHGITWTSGSLWHGDKAKAPRISAGIMHMVMRATTPAPPTKSAWRVPLMSVSQQPSCTFR